MPLTLAIERRPRSVRSPFFGAGNHFPSRTLNWPGQARTQSLIPTDSEVLAVAWQKAGRGNVGMIAVSIGRGVLRGLRSRVVCAKTTGLCQWSGARYGQTRSTHLHAIHRRRRARGRSDMRCATRGDLVCLSFVRDGKTERASRFDGRFRVVSCEGVAGREKTAGRVISGPGLDKLEKRRVEGRGATARGWLRSHGARLDESGRWEGPPRKARQNRRFFCGRNRFIWRAQFCRNSVGEKLHSRAVAVHIGPIFTTQSTPSRAPGKIMRT